MKRAKSYDEWLWKRLKDPREAAGYLDEALKATDDPSLFLTACYNVARSRGIKVVADRAKLHRVSVNKMLSKRGNPTWKSILGVLAASRLRFRVEPMGHARSA